MFDFERLDKIIHEKGRLAIMTLLASRTHWLFQDLKAELKMSDGNLITHLRSLQQAGYATAHRESEPRPRTRYELTDAGRKAFNDYLSALEEMVNSARRTE
jgi:DNA-binding HxlR family transcriptional regulator